MKRIDLKQVETDHRVAVRSFIEEQCELARHLPVQKRCLFLMHYEEGYSYEDIAKVCRCDPETVRRRLKRITDDLIDKRAMCQQAISEGSHNGTE